MRDVNELPSSFRPVTSLRAEDRILAASLRQAVRELGATTAIAQVPIDDGQMLASVVVVGDPFSIFIAADLIAVDDDRYASAIAYRTGRQCVFDEGRDRTRFPYNYSVVATPLAGADGRPAIIMVCIWVDPVGWAAVPAGVRDRCRGIAERLSRRLDRQGDLSRLERGALAPRFILTLPPEQDGLHECMSLSLAYQFGRLAAHLTKAPHLRDVVDIAVARIMKMFGAQCLAVSVIENERPRLLGYGGCSQAFAERLTRASGGTLDEETISDERSSGGEPLFFTGVSTNTPIVAFCLLPLNVSGHDTGTLALGFDHQRVFRPDERAALTTMVQILAQSIGRARQFEVEHRVAQELQQSLLPPALPHHAEMDIAARYVSQTDGAAVGGDWYDVLSLPDGSIGLVIGDVEGHSSRAAAIMGQTRIAIRAYAAEGHRTAEVLTRTNRLLTDLGTDLLVTCCCAWLDPEAQTVEISAAGHPRPLLSRPGHRFTVPDFPPGMPLGVRPDTCYNSARLPLPEGSLLVLYTNGLVHSHSVRLEEGIAALHERLTTPGELRLEVLADRLLEITGVDGRRDDDAAVLIAQFLGLRTGRRRRVGRMIVHRHDLRAVRDVRNYLREKAHTWGWEAVSSDLELAVTELVTNALVHADSEVEVRLREYDDRLRVDVCDSDPQPPLPAPVLASGEAETQSEHGRGLIIVDALASNWGNSPSGRGKSVWLEMHRPPKT